MKKAAVSLLLAASLLLETGNLVYAATEESGITLVYAEMNPEDTVIGQLAAAFKEKVEELSSGQITIEVHYAGELGSENTVLDSMLAEEDTVQIARISAFALNRFGAEKSVLLSLPYTFESHEHFWNFAKSDLAQELLNDSADELPVRGLFYGEEGFRHFFTVDEIKSYQDLEGKKIRVSDDPIMNGMVESLGGTPALVDFPELYDALGNGKVDAAEQPIPNYMTNGFSEAAPYLLLDGHTLGIIEIIISDSAWDKLSEEQQSIIMEAAEYAQTVDQYVAQEAENRALDLLKSDGVTIIEVDETDKHALHQSCSALIDSYTKDDLKDIYSKILEMADN